MHRSIYFATLLTILCCTGCNESGWGFTRQQPKIEELVGTYRPDARTLGYVRNEQPAANPLLPTRDDALGITLPHNALTIPKCAKIEEQSIRQILLTIRFLHAEKPGNRP